MDVLARLRSDMHDAGHGAYESSEDETDACLEILDEFSAEYEVLRTVHYPEGGRSRCYYAEDDGPEEEGVEHVSILVPRERKPSLLGAAEALDAAVEKLALSDSPRKEEAREDAWTKVGAARAALAEAIEKEKSNA